MEFVLVVGLSIAGMRCSVWVLPELVRGGESRFDVEKSDGGMAHGNFSSTCWIGYVAVGSDITTS